ncbi:hypothetical protein ACFWBC_10345 [Streptomyces sp. NPDC059985]|uniref:hypothetical protein n=1 Tax=Streptomyces sp. NPDC059985 TaxID=3347025 RepID=UPI0036759032
MSSIATATLTDRTDAVVHTESLGWGEATLSQHGRGALVAAVLEGLGAEAESFDCAALRDGSTAATKVVFRKEHGMVWAEVRVLCADARCRKVAEQYEQEHGHETPDAVTARAWARSADEETRDWAQELAAHAVLDANLARLRASDPDAAALLPEGCFSAELTRSNPGFDVGNAVQRYAAAKHAAGRMDLYHSLFAGTDAAEGLAVR